jgi:HPt (histidine-containing phosphotransfer) domain-containing protein
MHFDYNKLMERLDNDNELIDQLLVLTKEYLKDFIPKLENLINQNNVSGIKSHIHKMKGTALSVCFNNIANQTSALETLDNYNDSKFNDLKSKISIEVNYLINLINEKTKVLN